MREALYSEGNRVSFVSFLFFLSPPKALCLFFSNSGAMRLYRRMINLDVEVCILKKSGSI